MRYRVWSIKLAKIKSNDDGMGKQAPQTPLKGR